MYNKENFTYGCELEWGDIDRNIILPELLATWDYSETDIINLRDPFKYICADPQGISPNVGGEINTKPTTTILGQCTIIRELIKLFDSNNCMPTSNCLSHFHVHVHIPGLRNDIEALRKLTKYIFNNQATTVAECGRFDNSLNLIGFKGAKMYLKYDGGRQLPQYIVENIINKANDFESFIKLHAAGKDGVSMGRPFRYAINMYSLKHTDTIEFRMFRSTTNIKEMQDCFTFAQLFIEAALTEGPTVETILNENNFNFPNFIFDSNQYNGWLATKYPKERGKKIRTYYNAT